MDQPIEQLLQDVSVLLLHREIKIVFAESCTGGLISATLARVAGISAVHCGSAVVYRLDTKTQWLGIPIPMLVDPGPVSEPVARAMSEGVLARTPEAVLAVAITGHLGPNAPREQDGLIFVGITIRGKTCRVVEHRLPQFDSVTGELPFPSSTQREQRQWAAVEFVFSQIASTISCENFGH